MAFANIGVWTISDAFTDILEEYGVATGADIADIFDSVLNENGFDGF